MITTVRKQQVAKLSRELRRAFDLAGEGNLAEALPIHQCVAQG